MKGRAVVIQVSFCIPPGADRMACIEATVARLRERLIEDTGGELPEGHVKIVNDEAMLCVCPSGLRPGPEAPGALRRIVALVRRLAGRRARCEALPPQTETRQ